MRRWHTGLPVALVTCAVLIVLFTLGVAAPGAQAQDDGPPRHTDHDRAEPSAAVLLATAQGTVDAGANALETTLAGEDRQRALEQAERASQLASSLQEASQIQTRRVQLQPLLATLGPVGAELGPSLANLTTDGHTLFHEEDASQIEHTLAWINITQDLPTARSQLAPLAEEDIETQRLAEALDAYEARFEQVPEPAETGARLTPQPAHLGEQVRLTVYQPDRGQAQTTVEAFDVEHETRLDDNGLAEVTFEVPWEAETGTHPVNVSWANDSLQRSLAVERVPTAWTRVQADPPGEARAVRAKLVDHDDEGLPRAPLSAWLAQRSTLGSLEQAGTGTDEDSQADEDPRTEELRRLSTRTSDAGRMQIVLEPGERGMKALFAGNRTHEPAELTWEDPWMPTGQQDEGPDLADLFERVGQSEPPQAPPTRWALAGAILAATLAVVALEVDQAVWRLQAQGRGLQGWLLGEDPRLRGPQATPVASTGAFPADHPVARALRVIGYDPNRLTLRQAAEVLEGMGAPDVQLWAVQHERAYYMDRPAPPVPEGLEQWVEELP